MDTLCKYDPKTNSWHDLAAMTSLRGRFDVAIMDGFLYAAGGSNGQNETSSAEKYDIKGDKWMPIPSLPDPVSSIGK